MENSEKSEISGISEKLFRVFFFLSFLFCPTAKIKNLDLKIPEKKFLRFQGFLRFLSFWPGPVLTQIEENSEHCCLWLNITTFFPQTDSLDCLHKISCTLCVLFTYCLFQSELKQSAYELCSLFIFKQFFGQLQQIGKKGMNLKTHFSYIIVLTFCGWFRFQRIAKVFKSFSNEIGSTLVSHVKVPL